jgi:predicted membrane protein
VAVSIIFGIVVLAVGLWDYSGYGRHTSARRLWMFIWLVYAEVPIGLAFTLVGLGSLVSQRPISDWLMVIGLASGGVGIVLIFWHPRWVRPTWLRGPLGD